MIVVEGHLGKSGRKPTGGKEGCDFKREADEAGAEAERLAEEFGGGDSRKKGSEGSQVGGPASNCD